MDHNRVKNLGSLAKLMNQQNVTSIPVTKKLIECFDVVITPEENEFLLQMGTAPHTYKQARSITDLDERSFETFFRTMLNKGLIWARYSDDGEEYFELAPILLGWFEIYLSDGKETPDKKEFAQRVENLFQSWGRLNTFPVRNLWNYKHRQGSAHKRIVAAKPSDKPTVRVNLNRKVDVADTIIYPSVNVIELIETYGDKNKIAVVHCFCRQWRKMVDDPCRFDYPAQSCIVIGSLCDYVVNYGIGKNISKDEALQLIYVLQEKGAVHQVYHERENIDLPEIAICNCCWDCCGVIGSYNRGILPLHFKSYYRAEVTAIEACTGCRKCVKYCPVEAISLVNKKIRITGDKCIGCGQCELKCAHVIDMKYDERDVILPLQKKSTHRFPSG